MRGTLQVVCALAAAVCGPACAARSMGVELAVDSSALIAAGLQPDAFEVRVVDAGTVLDTRTVTYDRAIGSVETITLPLAETLAGQRLRIEADALAAGAVVATGFTEVEAVARDYVPAQILLSACLAAAGPFCDEATGELVTCDPLTSGTVRAPCAYGCNAARLACNECTPDTVACNATVVVTCGADGRIVTTTTCPVACLDGSCAACNPGTVDCRPDPVNGDAVVTCDAAGNVTGNTPCPYGCIPEAEACNACYAGLTHCIGDDLVVCDAMGGIASSTPCAPYGCNGAGSPAWCNACNPSTVECQGDQLVDCDALGSPATTTDCAPFGCEPALDPDACRACDPALPSQCLGDLQTTCSAEGTVVTQTDCGPGNCNAAAGQCNSCTPPGSPFCTAAGDVAQCNADGTIGAVLQSCPYGCVEPVAGMPVCNACTPAAAGTTALECQGIDLVECDDAGGAVATTPCAFGCAVEPAGDDRCNECVPSATACAGGASVVCDATGRIASTTPCAYGCSAVTGACNACTPGASECQGSNYVVCDAAGSVVTSVPCATVEDQCNGSACTPGGCVPVPVADGTPCDDGQFCTAAEACSGGTCGGGAANACSDGNPCTSDVCDEAANACANPPVASGTPCSDGLFCTVGETCGAGTCGGGAANPCSDLNACTADLCDEGGDACLNPPLGDGTPCDDGQFCTLGESCIGGACGGAAPNLCEDGNACTANGCDEATNSCTTNAAVMNGMPCDDGLGCTSGDACFAGGCIGGAMPACDDSDPCTVDYCDEAAGGCVNDPAAADDAPCGVEMICCSGSCIASDESNCGACGNVCPAPGGACMPADLCFRGTCVDEGIVVITELMINPMVTSDAVGEWVEVYNTTARDIDLGGWVLRDDATDLHTISTFQPVIVPAFGFAVLVRSGDPALNCGISGGYQYSSFVLGNMGDEVVLEASGCEVDRVNYTDPFDSDGNSKYLDAGSFDHLLNDNLSAWCTSVSPSPPPMTCGDDGSPGTPNPSCP